VRNQSIRDPVVVGEEIALGDPTWERARDPRSTA
jgi:hypothetical protein